MNALFRLSAVLLPAAAAVLLLGGCSSSRNEPLYGKARAGYAASPSRILVDDGLEEDVADEFEASLRAALARCGVRIGVNRPFSVRIDNAREARRLGAHDHAFSVQTFASGEFTQIQFTLSDAQGQVWSGSATVEGPVQADAALKAQGRFRRATLFYQATARNLAHNVVQSWRQHGVLRTCPAGDPIEFVRYGGVGADQPFGMRYRVPDGRR